MAAPTMLRMLAAALAVWFVAGNAAANARETIGRHMVRTIVFNTHSPITIVKLGGGTMRRHGETEPAAFSCLAFRNTDAREATSVVFHIVFYNSNGDRIDQADLTRAGHFATGVDIADAPTRGDLNFENCVQQPPVHTSVATIFIFVKNVTYAGGSTWSTAGPSIPERLGDAATTALPVPATLDPLPAATPEVH